MAGSSRGLYGSAVQLASAKVIAGVAPTATGYGCTVTRTGLGAYTLTLDEPYDPDQIAAIVVPLEANTILRATPGASGTVAIVTTTSLLAAADLDFMAVIIRTSDGALTAS